VVDLFFFGWYKVQVFWRKRFNLEQKSIKKYDRTLCVKYKFFSLVKRAHANEINRKIEKITS
jgi:hypothetical protein